VVPGLQEGEEKIGKGEMLTLWGVATRLAVVEGVDER